ncbi:hypothetical protein G6F35_013481 [Rhizopus arrhizus]|nr:hypothetical protein G6F35_013481 [Rhizopus arrhizus]
MRQLCLLIIASALHHHHELALALVLVAFHLRQQTRQVAIQHGLEQLGQLARQHRRALAAEDRGHVGQRLGDAVRGFVEHHRAHFAGQQLQAVAAAAGLGRQEALEAEAVAGQPGHAQRGDGGAGARNRADLDAGRARGTHQAETGVADQRRTGIADQRQRFAGLQARHQALRQRFLVVFVQGHQRLLDAEMGQQLAAAAGVLGTDGGHRTQNLLRARAQIGQVADREW